MRDEQGSAAGDELSIRTASIADIQYFIEDRDDRHHLLDHLANGRGILLFAFRGCVFAGHVFLRLGPAEEPELRDGLPGVPRIQHLKVVEQQRHSGVGRRLLSEAEDRLLALGYNLVALGVHPENKDAIRLYAGLSYSAWRAQHLTTFSEHVLDDGSTWRNPEPCLVFTKHLRSPTE